MTHPCYNEHQPGCDCIIPKQTETPVPSFLKRMTMDLNPFAWLLQQQAIFNQERLAHIRRRRATEWFGNG